MKYYLFFLVILIGSSIRAQDTTFVRSLPLESFVRNIDTDGESLYLRLEDDIYSWKEDKLNFLQEGKFKYSWVQHDRKRNLNVINHNNNLKKQYVENAKKLGNLLPGDYNYTTTSCSIGNDLYVCYNGLVLQYRIAPSFKRFHVGNSIRHIYSEPGLRVISTYEGIFVDTIFNTFTNTRIQDNLANYSNGEVIKIDSSYYVCQDNLLLFKPSSFEFTTILNTEGTPRFRKIITFEDITYALYDRAFGIIELDTGERTYLIEDELTDCIVHGDNLYISSLNSILYELDSSGSISEFHFDGPINDLMTNGEDLFIGTTSGLFKKNGDEYNLVIPNTEILQSVIFEDKIVFTNNKGLYFFDQGTTTSLIENIEFNKMALNLDEHYLYAGSVNGLYVIETSELSGKIANTPVILKNGNATVVVIGIMVGLLLIILIYRFRKTKKQQLDMYYPRRKVVLNSNLIREAVMDNPKLLSVSLIAEHFNTNVVQINRQLKKEELTGLKLLKSIMKEIAVEMYRQGYSLDEISKRVGYSNRYIKSKFLK